MMKERDVPLGLGELIVLALDLRDEARRLNKQAELLYDKTMDIAILVRYPKVDLGFVVSAMKEEEM